MQKSKKYDRVIDIPLERGGKIKPAEQSKGDQSRVEHSIAKN